jgi:hypothetical protein
VEGPEGVCRLEIRQGHENPAIFVYVTVSEEVSDGKNPASDFKVYKGSNKDTSHCLQPRDGCLAHGTSSGSFATCLGNGSGSFVCHEREDVQNG